MADRRGMRGFTKFGGVMVPVALAGTVLAGAQSWKVTQSFIAAIQGAQAGRLEQELDQLEVQLQDRSGAIGTLQTQVEALNRQLSGLREQNLDLRKTLGASQLELYQLKEGSEQGRGGWFRRSADLGEGESQQLARLQRQYEEAQQRLEQVSRSSQELERRLGQLTKELETQRGERQSLQRAAADAEASREALTKRLEQLRADLSGAEQRLRDREAELQARLSRSPDPKVLERAAARERELLSLLEDRDQQIETLTDQLTRSTSDMAALSQERDALRARVHEITTQLEGQKRQREALSQQLQRATEEAASRGELGQQAVREVRQLQQQMGEMAEQMKEQLTTIEALTDEATERELAMTALTSERDMLDKQLLDAMAQVGPQQARVEALTGEVAAVRAALAQREAEAGRRAAQILALQDQLDAVTKEREGLRVRAGELSGAVDAGAQTITVLREQLTQTRQALDEAKAEITVVQAQLTQTETMRDGLRRQLEASQHARQDAAKRLASVSSLQSAFQEQLAQLMQLFAAQTVEPEVSGQTSSADADAGASDELSVSELQQQALELGERVQQLLGIDEPLTTDASQEAVK